MEYLYCAKCSEHNLYDGRICTHCGTRLDNPTEEAKHNFAYPRSYGTIEKITCPSPSCGVQVWFPAPLENGAYKNVNEAKKNRTEVVKLNGVFCWNCGQFVPRQKKNSTSWTWLWFVLFLVVLMVAFLLFMMVNG